MLQQLSYALGPIGNCVGIKKRAPLAVFGAPGLPALPLQTSK